VHRGRFIAGLVLTLIGVIVVVASLELSATPTTVTIVQGTDYDVKLSALTDVPTTVSWTGQPNVTVYLMTGSPTCILPLGVVRSATGTSGSFTASLKPGKSYYLYGCTGTTATTVRVTVAPSYALTELGVLGGIALALGIFLLVVGIRAKTYRYRREGYVWMTGPPTGNAQPAAADAPGAGPAAPSPPLLGPPAAPTGAFEADRPVPDGVGRTLQGCPNCGKVYTSGQYATCPSCGAPL
jgi:hypothetical protein